MFECTLEHGAVLKKLIAAIGELVENANFDCTEEGIALQAMDSSHVALVNVFLSKDGFSEFRADRELSLGISLKNMLTIMKCSGAKDSISLKVSDDGDVMQLLFENEEKDRIL